MPAHALPLPSPAKAFANAQAYCSSLTQYARWHTREVMVGSLGIGGNNPIRLQSMTTTDTMDTAATVAQSIRMIEAGSELVRITAPSINEARNLEHIRKQLRARGYEAPLIADIHFTPNAAEVAARIVEKVRINPGNFADKKRFDTLDYTDAAYAAELERIRSRFVPLVRICKEYGTAMRIGTNHGSLSDRIMSRYGDTPEGMVESALEFLRIAEDEGYYNIVLSMKASNPKVMVEAYRLLVARMAALGMNYPLHLGVTEAGDGEDGRTKSAVGIGSLLEDGLGDTVRVSLTEEPEHELPVARALVAPYAARPGHAPLAPAPAPLPYNPFAYARRRTFAVGNIGADNPPRVVVAVDAPLSGPEALLPYGYRYDAPTDKWHIADQAADYLWIADDAHLPAFELPQGLALIVAVPAPMDGQAHPWHTLPAHALPELWATQHTTWPTTPCVLFLDADDLPHNAELLQRIAAHPQAILALATANAAALMAQRRACMALLEAGIHNPVLFVLPVHPPGTLDSDVLLQASVQAGGLLLDGFGDALWVPAPRNPALSVNVAYNVLQATRTRISKTEYIACPSCGRTLFDLQETTAKIRAVTSHLKGVKIGIMGCIVNGPGEMADADFGYVGSGPGKITLYRGRDVVQKNVPEGDAVELLIALIKQEGMWVGEG